MTSKAVCAWVKSWAPIDTTILTPGNQRLSLNGEKEAHCVHFVYFILNVENQAIKIGRAKDLQKRMKALQTSSPVPLSLIKATPVNGIEEAHQLEQSIHRQFHEIRLSGEWFKAENGLLDYIEKL